MVPDTLLVVEFVLEIPCFKFHFSRIDDHQRDPNLDVESVLPCFKFEFSRLSGVISRALQMNLELWGGGDPFDFIVSQSPHP